MGTKVRLLAMLGVISESYSEIKKVKTTRFFPRCSETKPPILAKLGWYIGGTKAHLCVHFH